MKRVIKFALALLLTALVISGTTAVHWVVNATSSDQLRLIADKLDILLKSLSAVAVLIGGAWAFYKYIIGGATSWMNNISLDTKVLPYRDDLRLLVIHVRSTNPRATKFEFDETNATFKLAIRLLPIGNSAQTVLDEEFGQVIASIDLMRGSGGYELLPGATLDDMRSVVLPLGAIASLTAELKIKRWWQAEADFISTSSVVRIES
ncbi:hypothetical protein [Ralstonia holmesii]|uniref:Uncharacterized protein n=1 Tax=Ralstonia holmesii TaxID=3058602 RepID=A0ABC8QK53_9RALS|nr:hypothetical protein [Ralstonia sp. LMG 32967]CAJ0802377.1 hypothetical protein LMG18096_04116 [Ralstonia sp. LMG 32967]CAJ0818645.1 hypothetical protein LMG18093_03767 [Ralstonia sp. LMG 32967]